MHAKIPPSGSSVAGRQFNSSARFIGPFPLGLQLWRFSARAPPDFLNDNAVVLFAFPVPNASFEYGRVDFEKRQLLSDFARLIQHQMRILESLTHAPFGRKITGKHFRPFGL